MKILINFSAIALTANKVLLQDKTKVSIIQVFVCNMKIT
jgi:hypothetical protein